MQKIEKRKVLLAFFLLFLDLLSLPFAKINPNPSWSFSSLLFFPFSALPFFQSYSDRHSWEKRGPRRRVCLGFRRRGASEHGRFGKTVQPTDPLTRFHAFTSCSRTTARGRDESFFMTDKGISEEEEVEARKR